MNCLNSSFQEQFIQFSLSRLLQFLQAMIFILQQLHNLGVEVVMELNWRREIVPVPMLAWNRENVVALALKLRTLHAQRKIVFKRLIVDCGLIGSGNRTSDSLPLAQQRLSRWMRDVQSGSKWQRFSEAEYTSVVCHLFNEPGLWNPDTQNARIDSVFPDAMFHAMASWIGMTERSFGDVINNFPGVFTIYRHSLLKPGHVLIGRMDIEHDSRTGAVRTLERYHVSDPEVTTAKDFELSGYIFRKNGKYRIISKAIGSEELQHMYINSVDPQGGTIDPRQVIRMSGVLCDIQGQFFYATRFCCVRRVPECLTSVPYFELNKSIKVELGSTPVIDGYGHIAKF